MPPSKQFLSFQVSLLEIFVKVTFINKKKLHFGIKLKIYSPLKFDFLAVSLKGDLETKLCFSPYIKLRGKKKFKPTLPPFRTPYRKFCSLLPAQQAIKCSAFSKYNFPTKLNVWTTTKSRFQNKLFKNQPSNKFLKGKGAKSLNIFEVLCCILGTSTFLLTNN